MLDLTGNEKGLMPVKKDLDPKFAMSVALDFLARTKDLYRRSEVAGSLRRKAPVVHDVDIAVIPKGSDYEAWKGKVTDRVKEIGGSVITFGAVISNFLYKGVQVNLFICPGGDSWGVTYMWATGPKGHTIGMTIKARNKGLLINSTGIWTRDEQPKLIPARTEHDVGRILGWKYKPPEERGKVAKKEPSFY
jgi:DNA polymerase/3'-5' exonuclease PolX